MEQHETARKILLGMLEDLEEQGLADTEISGFQFVGTPANIGSGKQGLMFVNQGNPIANLCLATLGTMRSMAEHDNLAASDDELMGGYAAFFERLLPTFILAVENRKGISGEDLRDLAIAVLSHAERTDSQCNNPNCAAHNGKKGKAVSADAFLNALNEAKDNLAINDPQTLQETKNIYASLGIHTPTRTKQ